MMFEALPAASVFAWRHPLSPFPIPLQRPGAGIVVVSAADMMRVFRRHGPSDEECRIYRIRPQASAEWQYITEPADGVVIKITDLMLLADEVQKF